jgi:integrase
MRGADVGEDKRRVARAGPLGCELEHVSRALVAAGLLSAQSHPRVLGLLDRFGLFASRAYGVEALTDVQPLHVEAFVRSANAATSELPSVATMRLRRSALRLLFRTGRDLGLVAGDPTLDLVLPSRTKEAARPLTDLEVQRCRRAALEDLTSTRLSVPWGLGEATARTAEIPHLRVADLDLSGGRVWLHGSSNTEARWGHLTRWGASQLERHLRLHPPGSDDDVLTQRGTDNPESRRSHSAQALRETMRRADLTRDPYVRPGSLAAWAGRRVLGATGRIDAAALALGMRSLDGAARLIGWDWASEQALVGG